MWCFLFYEIYKITLIIWYFIFKHLLHLIHVVFFLKFNAFSLTFFFLSNDSLIFLYLSFCPSVEIFNSIYLFKWKFNIQTPFMSPEGKESCLLLLQLLLKLFFNTNCTCIFIVFLSNIFYLLLFIHSHFTLGKETLNRYMVAESVRLLG